MIHFPFFIEQNPRDVENIKRSPNK